MRLRNAAIARLIETLYARRAAQKRQAPREAILDPSIVHIRSPWSGGFMTSLSMLMCENGLPDLPVVLIEPHRNGDGYWRIKFSYDADQPLSMSSEQATLLATDLYRIGEAELAGEIDDAVANATRYGLI
jgi:hypothetical protein